MPVKKVTRKKSNNPVVDTALSDIYDKLDKLQPINPRDRYTTSNQPEEGTMATVEVTGNESESGTMSSAVFTKNGWMVDINSNYKRIGTTGFIASEGMKGRSKTPVQGEALSYDKNHNIVIGNTAGEKVLLKNTSGMLNVRNANDSADGDIRVANIKDANDNKSIEITSTGSAVNHLKFDNSAAGLGNSVFLTVGGTDTNAHLGLKPKGAGNINIIKDLNLDTSSSGIGLDIDYDYTGTAVDTAAIINKGFRVIMRSDAETHHSGSTITNEGISLSIAGNTNGTNTNYGMTLTCVSADVNNGISTFCTDGTGYDLKCKSSADSADYFTITTSTHGETTLTTVDSDAGIAHLTLDVDGDIILDPNSGITKFYLAGDTDDLCTLTVAANGATTIATTDSDGSEANLTLDVNGGLHIDTDSGEARITTSGSAYTPVHEQDIVIKGYVDGIKHTAVWGGNLGRVGISGTWLGIPTGYQAAVVRMGTGSSPDTSFTLTTTADDLVGSIWASMHDITVTGCKIWVGQGGATNTAHGVSLMRYDIDADGDLSNGVEVAAGSALNNDDYTQARAITLSLSGTAANLDIDFSDGQILMAFVEPTAAYNANLGAKVILEYTEAET